MARFAFLIVAVAVFVLVINAKAQDGFATVNGVCTGGAGGTVVTVTNGTDFNTQINIAGPRIIQVQGIISIGRIFTTSQKTIIGLGTNATLYGNLNISGVSNVIVQNLRITSHSNDGLTIWGANHVWVDHCTFYDCGDGCADMNNGSQYNTLSWCKFHYVQQQEHRFTMIADGQVVGSVTNYGYYTLHHNWWSTRCDQRQASSSYGRLHYYNNYWNCTNNSYATLTRADTEILSQSNYYAGVKDSLYTNGAPGGKIQSSGNIYSGCTGIIHPGTDTVFVPPYSYTPDTAATVPALIMADAGAPGPDSVTIPPKLWDGGGANNNLKTAANWLPDEIAKEGDTLLFAGGTRLAPSNDNTANTDFYSLVFSNNAGAFLLGGNAMNFGTGIINDSANVQTINLNLDFSYGFDHYGTNRAINVSTVNGSLVINGNVAGNTNAYFNSYNLIKSGAGLLTLNGVNTFVASLQLNGGLVRFQSLDTNQPGSLGMGNMMNSDGGGLQWAAGNTADISVRTVTINTNGATFDVGANTVTFTNRIGNVGIGSLTKLGSGTLVFNATNNYKGNTLIAQGTLALGLTGLLTNSPQIILSNNATLDVSARSDGTQTLLSGKSLVGNGTIRGSVTAASGSLIAPGFSIGTLVVTNVLTFQSGCTNLMEISATAHTNDLLTGMASVSYGGKLIVTNLGGTLAAGDSFKLFNAAIYANSFSSIILPPLTGSLIWMNKLSVDGTIVVVQPVNTSPTNITFSLNGGNLSLSWPADHTGWTLQVQTNTLSIGLGTNWVSVPGSTSVNSVTNTINPANGSVFYRLYYQ